MSFSFSIKAQPKKKNVSVQIVEKEPEKDFVIMGENGNIESTTPKNLPLVIPLESSTFKHHVEEGKKDKVEEDEEMGNNQDGAEVEKSEYGLIILGSGDGVKKVEEVQELPLILRNRPKELSGVMDETERFRRDVEMRPPEVTMDIYDKVPVSQFGEALLRGMGWSEGQAIGKNHTVPAEVIVFPKRPPRLGIGAKPQPEFFIGVKVKIIGGEYNGQIAKVTHLPSNKKDKAKAVLKHNGKEVDVLLKHMKKLRNQDDLPPTSKKRKSRKEKSKDKDKSRKKQKR
jgi:hypothetical protein